MSSPFKMRGGGALGKSRGSKGGKRQLTRSRPASPPATKPVGEAMPGAMPNFNFGTGFGAPSQSPSTAAGSPQSAPFMFSGTFGQLQQPQQNGAAPGVQHIPPSGFGNSSSNSMSTGFGTAAQPSNSPGFSFGAQSGLSGSSASGPSTAVSAFDLGASPSFGQQPSASQPPAPAQTTLPSLFGGSGTGMFGQGSNEIAQPTMESPQTNAVGVFARLSSPSTPAATPISSSTPAASPESTIFGSGFNPNGSLIAATPSNRVFGSGFTPGQSAAATAAPAPASPSTIFGSRFRAGGTAALPASFALTNSTILGSGFAASDAHLSSSSASKPALGSSSASFGSAFGTSPAMQASSSSFTTATSGSLFGSGFSGAAFGGASAHSAASNSSPTSAPAASSLKPSFTFGLPSAQGSGVEQGLSGPATTQAVPHSTALSVNVTSPFAPLFGSGSSMHVGLSQTEPSADGSAKPAFGFGLQLSPAASQPQAEGQFGSGPLPQDSPIGSSTSPFPRVTSPSSPSLFSFGQSAASAGPDAVQASGTHAQQDSHMAGSSVWGPGPSPGASLLAESKSRTSPDVAPKPIFGFSAPTLSNTSKDMQQSQDPAAEAGHAWFNSNSSNGVFGKQPDASGTPPAAPGGLTFGFGSPPKAQSPGFTAGSKPLNGIQFGFGATKGASEQGFSMPQQTSSPANRNPFGFGIQPGTSSLQDGPQLSTMQPQAAKPFGFGNPQPSSSIPTPNTPSGASQPAFGAFLGNAFGPAASGSAQSSGQKDAVGRSNPWGDGAGNLTGRASVFGADRVPSPGPASGSGIIFGQAIQSSSPRPSPANPASTTSTSAPPAIAQSGASPTGGSSFGGLFRNSVPAVEEDNEEQAEDGKDAAEAAATADMPGLHGNQPALPAPAGPNPSSATEEELGAGPPVVGTLEEMAHPQELQERSSDPLEREDPSDRATVKKHLAVMSFSKNKKLDPDRIRTRQALEKTQLHLRGLLDRSGTPLVELYAFLDNRNRALHGDYRVQHLSDHQILHWIAEHVRFGIMSAHELCEFPKGERGWDSQLNVEQINRGLITLNQAFEADRSRGEQPPVDLEAEMRSYQIELIHGEDLPLHLGAAFADNPLSSSPWLQAAAALKSAVEAGNPRQFFKLIASVPYHLAALCHSQFQAMRVLHLHELSGACPPPGQPEVPQPLSLLVHRMWLDDEAEAIQIAQAAGFSVDPEAHTFIASRGFGQHLSSMDATDERRVLLETPHRSKRLSARLVQPWSANTAQPPTWPGQQPQQHTFYHQPVSSPAAPATAGMHPLGPSALGTASLPHQQLQQQQWSQPGITSRPSTRPSPAPSLAATSTGGANVASGSILDSPWPRSQQQGTSSPGMSSPASSTAGELKVNAAAAFGSPDQTAAGAARAQASMGRSPGGKAKRGRSAEEDDGEARKKALQADLHHQQQHREQEAKQAEADKAATRRRQQAERDDASRTAAAAATAARAEAARAAATKQAEAARAAAAKAQLERQAAAHRQQLEAQQRAQACEQGMQKLQQLATTLRMHHVLEDWRELVRRRKAIRQQQEEHRLAGLRAMRVCGPYISQSPRSAIVAYPAHKAWQNVPDPAALDASALNLPGILGPILSAAAPDATHLYSKPQASTSGELVAEHASLPSGQSLWSAVHDASAGLNSSESQQVRAEQLRQQLAGCTGLIFLATPTDPPQAAATWFSRLLDAAPLGPPRRHFEEILHSLPLLVVATSEDMAEQAGEQLLQASQGQLRHLRCLAVSSQRPNGHTSAHHDAGDSPRRVLSHALAYEGISGHAGSLVPTGEGQMAAMALPGAACRSVQPYDSAALVSGLRWLAKHRPEPPTMQALRLQDVARRRWQQRRERLVQNRVRRQGPEDWRQAFNAALSDTAACVRSTSNSAAGVWQWPPPECAKHGSYQHLPVLWHTSDHMDEAVHIVARTHLLEWDELQAACAGNLQTVTTYMQKIAGVPVPGRTSGSWQELMNDGCSARLASLPQAFKVMLSQDAESPSAPALPAPHIPSLLSPGLHWSSAMGGPRLSIPAQGSRQADDVDSLATQQPPANDQGRGSLPKRDCPDQLRASKSISPAKRRRYGPDDAEMESSAPNQHATSPPAPDHIPPAYRIHGISTVSISQANQQLYNGGSSQPCSPVQDLLQDVHQEVLDLQRRQAELVCILAAGGPPPRRASGMATACLGSSPNLLQEARLILP
ncbi:hypothetical protein WJX74_008473 [Apatococcus lobatus]|uniref:SAC3/GANP/THP3 conserved domain-containing protein n=1 Tax=Apatococcus lobatus TaxID=904363 RepID=A0AAW1S6Z2_9CHLO